MSAPGSGKKDSDAFKTSGLRRSPPGSAPTRPVSERPPDFRSLPLPLSRTDSSDSVASVSSKQRTEDESATGEACSWGCQVGGNVEEALGVVEINTAKMGKANNVATLRDSILELEREIAKQRADVAYLRGRVDERSSIIGYCRSVMALQRDAEISCASWAKDLTKAVNPTIFIKPAERKRAVKDIHKDVFASLIPIAEGLKIRNL
ncbi:hypothetical protein J6590_102229 [Homalodisca vitripennis]|nr:hypothetical protein J6590_102229 [Homalodisca vitripennis]